MKKNEINDNIQQSTNQALLENNNKKTKNNIRIRDVFAIVLIVALTTVIIIIYAKSKKDYSELKIAFEEEENNRLEILEQYNDLVSNRYKMNSEENKKLEEELSSIKEDYSGYKENMQQYEGLAQAEIEARKAEADKIIQESIEAAERASIAEKESREAEEALGYETGITYEQLARTPDDFKDKKIKFTGKVVQIVEGDKNINARIAVNSDYNMILYCIWNKGITSSRILEEDIVTICGVSQGLYSYESTLGAQITIPLAKIDKVERK